MTLLLDLRVSMRRLAPVALPLVMGLVACGSSGDGGGGASGPSEVAFHADVSAIPGVSKDTGLQPSGSPVQLQLKVSASGNGAIDAAAFASGSAGAPVLTSKPGSGKVSVQGGFALEGRLVASVTGLPSYDGPVPGLDNVKIEFKNDAAFDPYLLSGTAVAKAAIPATDLPSIPLPGGLPGSLIIKVADGSTVNLEFHGVCASIQGDQAQYTGTITRSGSLILQPRVEIDVPMLGKKTFDIPEVTVPIAVPAEAVDLGKKTVAFGGVGAEGGETAKVGTCDAVGDGGVGGASGGGGAGGTAGGGNGGSSAGGNGGVGGSSGQGGTGAGGTGAGGTGTGGTGGSSCAGLSCASSSECCADAPECVSNKCTQSACQACGQGACANQIQACSGNSECAALWTCYNACTGDANQVYACSQSCVLAHPSGQDGFFRLQGCVYAKCHESCGAPSCLFGSGNPACDTCMTTTCSSQCDVASDSQDCMTYEFCVSYCSGVSCTADCNSYPKTGCQPMEDCISGPCASQCGG
ncbi:MAG: hypothetical protein HY898_20890 [Deltaproteobacteria bacterium]|nr:hypothetical protein [Deltaproteobacteria bacterium]